MKQAKRTSRSGLTRRQFDRQARRKTDPVFSSFSKRQGYAIAFIVLLALGVPFAYWAVTGPLFHSRTPNPGFSDPLKALWYDCIPQASAWQTILMTFQTAGACAANTYNNDFQTAPNSTNPAIMLYQPEIHIDQASGKVLEFDFSFATGAGGTLSQSDIYLTTNATLPLTQSYDPYKDPNVAFLISFNGVQMNVYTQTVAGKTIQSQDGGCPHSGSVFLCMTYASIPVTTVTQISLQLNFTGVTNTPSVSNLAFWTCPGLPCTSIASKTQAELPQLALTSTYHLGIWQQPNANARQVTWYGSYDPPNPNPNANNQQNSMTIGLFTPNPPATQPAPYVDTGGFFGPIIRALISIGVFIGQNLISFGIFLASVFAPILSAVIALFGAVFTAVFNAIGSIWGDGSFGTQIASFFSSLSSYLANVFSNAIGFIGSSVTFLSNALSIITTFFNAGNNFIGLWTNLLAGIAALIGSLNTFFGTLLYWYNLGVFGFNIIIIIMTAILAIAAALDFMQYEDPIAALVATGILMFLLFILQVNNSTFNVIAGNSAILTSYQTAWTNTSFMLQLLPILFFSVMASWIGSLGEKGRAGFHGSGHQFLPHFRQTIELYKMLTIDVFKGGYWFFKESFDIVSKAIAALKGRWSPVEVVGTG